MTWNPFWRIEWYFRKKRILKKRDKLREYYQTTSLWLPPNSTQRQFRFFLYGLNKKTRVLKIQDRINSIEKLRNLLVRYTPADVYYTTSCWLDPQNLGPRSFKKKGKPGYELASNVYLFSELYFDIDSPGDFPLAKKETKRLVNFLQEKYNFKDIKIVFSGGKGFHVYVYDFRLQDFVEEIFADPRMREGQAQDVKLDIVKETLHKQDILIDAPITLDTRRIIRLPMTIHSGSKNRCEFVDINQIDNFVPKSLKNLLQTKKD
ncbi:MAG TPA: DNA primase small subunit domain-containing protein [candidate division Zixibacteria bacterium]|nr:DNA primase small subunit domain-containing protein [candidate division Zixibacteria bacterium]